MKPVALIFPGQGAQKVGMGKELYEASPQAKAILDQAQAGCAPDLLKVMFEGPEEKLTQTAYAQPAILAMSIAALKAFEAHPKHPSFQVRYAAGLSLGEYSALAASGTIDFAETLRLVQKRGSLMDAACKENHGGMAAVIGFDKAKLVEICRQTGAEVANFNSHEQIVITGHAAKVAQAIEAIKAAGGHKVIPLTVAGAFHSSLMKSAADKFAPAVDAAVLHPTAVQVISNVDGRPETTGQAIRQNLVRQITASVQWVASVEYIMSQGVTHFIEIGPGKVLKGLVRRINPQAVVHNIEKPSDIDALAA